MPSIKPILEVLAGIPSVVLGFFALTVINPSRRPGPLPGAEGFNLLAAGLGVGILTIPLVASSSEDAMRAVPARAPRGRRTASGARRITTSLRVVVPAAISGIVAALILAVSRAIGETMVVALAAGATAGSLFTLDPLGPGSDPDRCDGVAGDRQRPRDAATRGLPEPLLPGCCCS